MHLYKKLCVYFYVFCLNSDLRLELFFSHHIINVNGLTDKTLGYIYPNAVKSQFVSNNIILGG